MEKLGILAAAVIAFIPLLLHRPERRPRSLAPIQLISALGAWALVVVNGSAIAIGVREGSIILGCAGAATMAFALISFLRDGAARASRDTPEALKAVVDDLRQLLGGATRLGVRSLEAVVVGGRCPGVGVAVMRQGLVIVRVRDDVSRWLEMSQQQGGLTGDVVASFARFIVLHELAHVLNGDHRTYRFVRSVVTAHVVWVAAAAVAAVSLALVRPAPVATLVASVSVIVIFVTQSLVARRFIAERERLADWRAMQTLPPEDAARLIERRGRRRAGVNPPTQLEKLMTALKVQAPPDRGGGWYARLIALVWPEGDSIHDRSESAAGSRRDREPRPVLWAALLGMQCGILSMTLSVASLLGVTRWIGLSTDGWFVWMLAIVGAMSGPPVMFCLLRIDPARMSVRTRPYLSARVTVAVVFYLAFVASAIVLQSLHVRVDPASVLPWVMFAALMIGASASMLFGVWLVSTFGTRDGGGELRIAPRESWVIELPLIAAMALLLVPLSVAVSSRLGLGSFGSGRWVPLAMLAFSGFVVSTGMARSTTRALRGIAPLALLDISAPVYGFRLFWRDFYVDLSRTRLMRAAAIAMATNVVAMTTFVLAAASVTYVLLHAFSAETTVVITFFGSIALMALILVIPDGTAAYSGPAARLLDRPWLEMFERLLAAARMSDPPGAERLQDAIGRWLRNERFPDAVLPSARSVGLLAPLLTLVRLARDAGDGAVLDQWRGRIEHALRQIIANDAVAIAPRQPPSMHWTTLAATVVDEAELRDAFAFDRMLDQVDYLLDERLTHASVNLVADVVAACRLLRRHGRPGPDPQRLRAVVASSSLVSSPALRQSLTDLRELAALTGDSEALERLAPIVRSRMWEVLQLNPRKDVVLLLDCHLAAASLGELDGRHAAAGVIVGELADRISDELNAIAG